LSRAGNGFLALVLALAAAALTIAPTAATAEPALPEGFQDSIAIPGIEQPTNFRFAPDGRVFVAEKSGIILVYPSIDSTTPEVFADLRTDVFDANDRGLLGLALDPKFEQGRPYVYALYTYDHILGGNEPAPKWGQPNTTGDTCSDLNGGDACLVSGRLVRLTAENGHAAPSAAAPAQTVLAEGWCQQFSSHSIGDLQFGPEGDLYVSGGDGASFTSADYGQLGTIPNTCGDPPGGYGHALSPPTAEGGSLRAQNPKLLNGKILRVDPDTGEGIPTNPWGLNADPNERRIVAEGFRNPFRFTFDPKGQEIYTDNVGSSEIEEIDRFQAPPASVYNSGWPCYEGPVRQFQFDTLGLDVCESLYENEPASTSEPFFYYSHGQSVVPGDECPLESGSALGGISFYSGGKLPSKYENALFFSDAVRGCVWVMFPGGGGRPDPNTTELFMREGKIYPAVDIEEGPEGDLYYADLFGNEEYGDGAIHRITYSPGAPTARLSANPPYGLSLPLHVSFDASASSDPNHEPLTYEWDFDGNGTFETPGGATETRDFTQAELDEAEANDESLNSVVAVKVTNPDGLSSVARVTVYPGDAPPQPTIDSPAPSLEWAVGDEISLEGSAVDGEGHSISTPLSYYWASRLLHCPTSPDDCHAHPLQTFAGVRSGEFLAPEHDYPSSIEVTLRVADDRGLSGSRTVKIFPRTVDLALSSSPPGVELTAGLLQGPAPLTLTTVEGDHVLLSAPATATVGGKTYEWKSWSDGGARAHTVLAAADQSYEAVYEAVGSGGGEGGEGDDEGKGGNGGGGGGNGTPAGGGSSGGAGGEPSTPRRAPQTTLNGHPPKRTGSRVARFTFGTDESASFRCKLDGGRYRSCRSPRTYRGFAPGRHTFGVYAVDAVGDRDRTPATYAWTVTAKRR
jgi:glucose/arabinose dehydrogenase